MEKSLKKEHEVQYHGKVGKVKYINKWFQNVYDFFSQPFIVSLGIKALQSAPHYNTRTLRLHTSLRTDSKRSHLSVPRHTSVRHRQPHNASDVSHESRQVLQVTRRPLNKRILAPQEKCRFIPVNAKELYFMYFVIEEGIMLMFHS